MVISLGVVSVVLNLCIRVIKSSPVSFGLTKIVRDNRFTERGQLFSREEVRALQIGPNNLVFSGDSHGTVKVWHWPETKVLPSSG